MLQLGEGTLFTQFGSKTFLEDIKQRSQIQKDRKFTNACAMPVRASVAPVPPFWIILKIGNSNTAACFR